MECMNNYDLENMLTHEDIRLINEFIKLYSTYKDLKVDLTEELSNDIKDFEPELDAFYELLKTNKVGTSDITYLMFYVIMLEEIIENNIINHNWVNVWRMPYEERQLYMTKLENDN